MSWSWRTWDWFEEHRDKLYYNGDSEERFQQGKFRFGGGRRDDFSQMSRLRQGGTNPRVMHRRGIHHLLTSHFLAKMTSPAFITNVHGKHYALVRGRCLHFWSWSRLSRLSPCIQRWDMWRWTQRKYGEGLSLWSRELCKVQVHQFLLRSSVDKLTKCGELRTWLIIHVDCHTLWQMYYQFVKFPVWLVLRQHEDDEHNFLVWGKKKKTLLWDKISWVDWSYYFATESLKPWTLSWLYRYTSFKVYHGIKIDGYVTVCIC